MNTNATQSPDSLHRLVALLTEGMEAAEGAQVIIKMCFENQGRDPYNNDNYCRLLDWLKDCRSQLKQAPSAASCSALLAGLVQAYEREVNPANDWTQTAMTKEDWDAATKEYRAAKEWVSANHKAHDR